MRFSENITTETASNSERMKLINIGIEEFKSNPILGIGIGNYNVYAQEVLNYNFRSDNLTTHNIYLELLAETGIIGFILFISIYVLIGKEVLKLKNRNAILIYIYFCFFYFFNTFNGINRFSFSTIVGILIYFIELPKKENSMEIENEKCIDNIKL